MDEYVDRKRENKVKQILRRFFAQLDKKMQKKVKSSDCCCNNDKSKDKSCCS